MKSSAQTQGSGLGSFFNQAAVFSASNLTMGTIFGLGIMPYISASIIFQLLGSVWGPLEQLQKEGESGRKKINEYTRYATVVICIGQSWGYLAYIIHGTGGRSFVSADFLSEWTSAIFLAILVGHDYDHRHRLLNVAGRAD